jgi:hypothetical protein
MQREKNSNETAGVISGWDTGWETRDRLGIPTTTSDPDWNSGWDLDTLCDSPKQHLTPPT